MPTTISWLIERQVLFLTPSRYFDSKELRQVGTHVDHFAHDILSGEPLYVIHDLRAVNSFTGMLRYLKSAYPNLASISHHVVVLPDECWGIESKLLSFMLGHQNIHLAESLDQSFQHLQHMDKTLPNLRVAFRSRVRSLINTPLEEVFAVTRVEENA